jgi:hypothetical protein
VRWEGLTRLLRAAANDDGSAAWHDRLTPDAWQVIRLAAIEARELGHPCIAEEHVLLGLLRHRASRAAALLEARGLDLPTARADLHRVGPTLGSGADPAGALRTLGIDVEEVRGRLEATFGAHAVRSAEWRVRRRPRWRGGHPAPAPCAFTCWPSALWSWPPGSPRAAVTPGSDQTTCSTACWRLPATRWAPSLAAAAAGSLPRWASPPADPTRSGFSSKCAASTSLGLPPN